MDWIDKIYIISLDKHNNRKKHIFADLETAGFDTTKIEWIDAVDGNKLNIDELIDSGEISPTFKDPYGFLTKSIYGCALSHQKAYKTFLNSNDDVKTALILEDDASVTHTLLRLLLTQSIAYQKFMEEKDTFDWDVIVMGGQFGKQDYVDTDSLILKKMTRYPINYAAHSYVVTKNGARKLIESNKSIQFAADVNIHCSDTNLYCTPVSYFNQKMGNMNKSLLLELDLRFRNDVLYKQENWDIEEVVSSTTYGDYKLDTKDEITTLTSRVSKKIAIESIDWKPFTTPNGDVVEDWANIHLKTKTNE